MRSNKSANNALELKGRRLLWNAGLKGYRTNVKKLPGRPDVVFGRRKLAIFFHGCFWHGCPFCQKPDSKTNKAFWKEKIERNRNRDETSLATLRSLGYRVVVIWEHELKRDPESVIPRVLEGFYEEIVNSQSR